MIDTAEQADREFDKALKEVLQRHPSLKNEILQSFVRDTRAAFLADQIAKCPEENRT